MAESTLVAFGALVLSPKCTGLRADEAAVDGTTISVSAAVVTVRPAAIIVSTTVAVPSAVRVIAVILLSLLPVRGLILSLSLPLPLVLTLLSLVLLLLVVCGPLSGVGVGIVFR